jgi:NDP-sugar pyrophosphorylase family protein
MITTAVILAAGRGSRLKEITATRSKAMVPIAGKPMISRVMESLRDAGINRFVIVAAPHDMELRSFFSGDSTVSVLTQQVPRGSGDALKVCAGHIATDFLVCACDSLIPVDDISGLMEAHTRTEACVSVGVMEVPAGLSLASRSVVRMEGDRILDIIEKPQPHERLSNITALPLYVLSPEIFAELEKLQLSARGEYELPEAFRSVIASGRRVSAARISQRDDLTNSADLLALNEQFLNAQTPPVQIDPSVEVPADVTIHAPVLIEQGVVLGAGCEVGPYVYLERGVVVESGAKLSHVVATRGARVVGSVHNIVVTGEGGHVARRS